MLRNWFQTEMEKLRSMNGRQIAEYIWQYYKLWIVGIVGGLGIGVYLLTLSLSTPNENWLYVCFANVPPGTILQEEGQLHQDYADYAGFDLEQKNLIFDLNCYCHPAEKTYGNNYYSKLVALIDGGILDLLVMEEADLQAMGATGRLLDLQGESFQVSSEWEDRLIYCQPEDAGYGKDLVPVAVDLSGCFLTEADGPYPDGCAVALGAYSSHPEQLELFLTYFLEDANP